MNLIRKLALAIESSPTGFAPRGIVVEGYTAEQIGYHAHLMIDAGLAIGADVTHIESSSPEAILTGLTWQGHEFVDAARDESRWRMA